MPWLFITSIVVFVLAGLAVAVWLQAAPQASYEDFPWKEIARPTALSLTALGALLLVLASTNVVPVRNVGIVTSWGKPTDRVTGAGLKMTAPWENVEDWDASRQAFDHRGTNCVNVRISTLSNACVEVLIEYQVKPERAPEQWAAYKKDFTLFIGRLVDPAITLSLNDVFAAYNPLANVDKATGNLNVPTGPLADQVKTSLAARLTAEVEVLSVVITRVNHDEKTQATIDAYQQSINKGRVLDQDKINAEKQKAITETNAKVDPVTRCLELADKHGKEPGFCLGGGAPTQVTNK